MLMEDGKNIQLEQQQEMEAQAGQIKPTKESRELV